MKRLLFIPLIFICSTLWAGDPTECKEPIQLARMNPYIAGAGVAAAAGAYFYDAGSDTYPATETIAENIALGGKISVTSGTSVKKIGVKVSSTGNDAPIKIALFNDCPSSSCTRLNTGCTIAAGDIVVGWNDCTLGTPYSISPPVTLSVIVIAGSAGGGDNNVLNVNSTTGSCMWSNSLNYSGFPADPTAMNLVSNCGKGVRIYTE